MSSDGFFPRVAIWGVGLIGGSIGMAIRRAGLADEVIGIGRGEESLARAVRLGAIDRYVTDPAEGLAAVDLMILAMPVGIMADLAARWAPQVRPGMVVTDVGSAKEAVVAAWERHLAPGADFLGGHPMFGRERSGIDAADPEMVVGCRWVLTPGERTSPAALARVERLVSMLGARPLVLSPDQHDRRVAGASHLPQLVATALAATTAELDDRSPGLLDLAAGGFRDTTRIADSPADLWTEVFLANAGALQEAVLAFRHTLADLEAAIDAGDGPAIAAIFARAHQGRRRLSEAPATSEEA